MHIYIEKATAFAADLWDPRLGCLDACLFVCLVSDLRRPCKLEGPCGLDWLRQGTQLSHVALLCRREHRFREICWVLGPERWRPWHPVAACCGGVDPLLKKIR